MPDITDIQRLLLLQLLIMLKPIIWYVSILNILLETLTDLWVISRHKIIKQIVVIIAEIRMRLPLVHLIN